MDTLQSTKTEITSDSRSELPSAFPDRFMTPWYKPSADSLKTAPKDSIKIVRYAAFNLKPGKGTYLLVKQEVGSRTDSAGVKKPKLVPTLLCSSKPKTHEFPYEAALRHIQNMEANLVAGGWQEIHMSGKDTQYDYHQHLKSLPKRTPAAIQPSAHLLGLSVAS